MPKTKTIENMFYLRTLDETVDVNLRLLSPDNVVTIGVEMRSKEHEYELQYSILTSTIDCELPLEEEFSHINNEMKEKCLLVAIAYKHGFLGEKSTEIEEFIYKKLILK